MIVPPLGWKIKAPVFAKVVLLTLLLWLLLRDQGMPQTLSAPAIADWLNGLGYRGPLLLAAMMIIAVVVGPIPTLPNSATSGLAFGLAGGTLLTDSELLASSTRRQQIFQNAGEYRWC